MKLLSIFLLTLLMGKSCDSAKTTLAETASIEYTANTRGFYEKITIRNREAIVSNDRDGKDVPTKTPISEADWNQIETHVGEINLAGMPTLKAPSERRFYDGAAIAQLKITLNDNIYETPEFDHGTPNVEIEKLVNKILQYSNRK